MPGKFAFFTIITPGCSLHSDFKCFAVECFVTQHTQFFTIFRFNQNFSKIHLYLTKHFFTLPQVAAGGRPPRLTFFLLLDLIWPTFDLTHDLP